MTRDEAIKKANEGFGLHGSFSSQPVAFVDMAVALGLLNLDEPKSKIDAFWIALGERRGSVLPHDVAHMFDEFGIKIIEK